MKIQLLIATSDQEYADALYTVLAKRQADINVERWERGRARARERAERKAAKKNLSAAAVM